MRAILGAFGVALLTWSCSDGLKDGDGPEQGGLTSGGGWGTGGLPAGGPGGGGLSEGLASGGSAPKASGGAPFQSTGGRAPAGGGAIHAGGAPGGGGALPGAGGAAGIGGVPSTGGSDGGGGTPAERGPYFPAKGSTDQCPDPTLRIRLNGPPRVGDRGKVRVYDTAHPDTPAYSIDLAVPEVDDTIGGAAFRLPRPVFVHENEVVFVLPSSALSYGKTYAVTLDEGVLSGPDAQPIVISDLAEWRFSTAPAVPSDTSQLRVALDGTGQFCGVQGALDAIAPGGTIRIARGAYFGVTYFKGKDGLSLIGEDRETTLLLGVNNNNLNPSTRGRALFGTEGVSGLSIENLTIANQTPQGGSQAEALALLSCDRCIVRNSTIRSLQDTLLWSGRIYAEDSLIEGNVDYIWGAGTVYFNRVHIRTVGRKGYNVQARNSESNYGYVFVDSELSAEPGITGDVLARIDVGDYPYSHVAYIECELGPHISPKGWLISGAGSTAGLRFWEYNSRDARGEPIDVSQRMTGSRQLSATEAAQMRNASFVLGGWDPR